jgi:hypothetical protein
MITSQVNPSLNDYHTFQVLKQNLGGDIER